MRQKEEGTNKAELMSRPLFGIRLFRLLAFLNWPPGKIMEYYCVSGYQWGLGVCMGRDKFVHLIASPFGPNLSFAP